MFAKLSLMLRQIPFRARYGDKRLPVDALTYTQQTRRIFPDVLNSGDNGELRLLTQLIQDCCQVHVVPMFLDPTLTIKPGIITRTFLLANGSLCIPCPALSPSAPI